MKKLFLSICLILLVAVFANAQTPPEAFSYSAVARDPNSNPITNSTIGIQISLRQGSPLGTIVYQENHFVNTDQFGLFDLVVGGGAVQNGVIADIDWSADDYYMQVGMDATGGTNFLNMGATQLLSVPYALYAKNAGSVSGNNSFTHYIGEEFGGGVIFHLWFDAQGVEHGLIVALTDLSSSQAWSNIDAIGIGSSAQSTWDGTNNSNAIVSQAGHTASAAQLCLDYTGGGFSDWYLPSKLELSMLWKALFEVQKSFSTIPSAVDMQTYYWSSTETDFTPVSAWGFDFWTGQANSNDKNQLYLVRAIRSF